MSFSSPPLPAAKGPEPPAAILNSWKEIAGYLGRNERTVQRWEKTESLPVHRHRHAVRGSVYAYTSELDEWRVQRRTLGNEEEKSPEAPASPAMADVPAVEPEAPGMPASSRRLSGRFAAIALLSATALLAAVWLDGHFPPSVMPRTARILIDFPGNEIWPAFSPDGKQVAFAWKAPGASYDIYTKALAGGVDRRVTSDAAPDYAPRWSPDGRSIAFLRGAIGESLSVIVVSVPDLHERKVCDSLARAWLGQNPAWSRDGKWLIVPDKELPADPESLFAVSIETGAKRRLTLPPRDQIDFQPAVSPDGASLVFVRQAGAGSTDLLMMTLDRDLSPRGDVVRLSGLPGTTNLYPVWQTDGRSVLFAASSASRTGGIYRVSSLPGDARRAPEFVGSFGGAVTGLAYHASAGNAMLIFARDSAATFFKRVSVPPTGSAAVPLPLLSSNSANDGDLRFAPDGKRIALTSGRSGATEIWTANADGSNPVRLTFFSGANTGSPYWSPDGKNLVFDSAVSGWSQIFRVPAAGGQVTRLTFDRSNQSVPSWSRDGRWIYFASDRSGTYQVWKMPSSGSGGAVMVTRNGGFAAIESKDGATLFYTMSSSEDTPLNAVPVSGGVERQVLPMVRRRVFAVANDGIYFSSQGPYIIHFMRFSDGSISEQARNENAFNGGLGLSPDERTLIYAEGRHTGFKLMSIDGFR